MPSALVEKVRAKYGDTYKDLSDSDLESAVLAKHPEYADLASPKARVAAAVDRSVAGAETGAKARSSATPAQVMGTVTGEDNEQITPEVSTQKAKAGLGAAALAAPLMVGARVAGAGFGGYEGYKRAGLPGMVAGATAGAVAPGVTSAGLAGAAGWDAGGMRGAVIAGVLAHVLPGAAGRAAKLLKAARAAEAEAPEVATAAGKVLQFSRTPFTATGTPAEAASIPRATFRLGEEAVPVAKVAAKEATAPGPLIHEATGLPINPDGTVTLRTNVGTINVPAENWKAPTPGAPLALGTAPSMPAVAAGQKIEAQVQTLRAAGLSKPQIVQALRETYGHSALSEETAGKMYDMIAEARGPAVAATEKVLPTGSKLMPSYRGGKAQPYLGPARVPENDQDLMSLLRSSVDAHKSP